MKTKDFFDAIKAESDRLHDNGDFHRYHTLAVPWDFFDPDDLSFLNEYPKLTRNIEERVLSVVVEFLFSTALNYSDHTFFINRYMPEEAEMEKEYWKKTGKSPNE